MQGYVNAETRKRLLALVDVAVENFDNGDWKALGVHTGSSDLVEGNDRLLRSLFFSDPDYEGCAHSVMLRIVERDHANLPIIDEFIGKKYGGPGVSVSTAPSVSKPIVFTPSVFQTPTAGVEADLVAVMMPFTAPLQPVYEAIKVVCSMWNMRCLRADDIWDHSVVIQDIFSLIYRAQIVVCDFTGKNPNVFYEAGIAHTLGKHVVPITQNAEDIPFDLRHHRYIHYLNNEEGRIAMEQKLYERMRSLRS